ncbi:MAG: dihydrofolate reductase [Candidatus Saccharibacteria bacterium]|nr:dihydrofolate reductase [Candidatus Saccharibacteria bacterium]
MFSLIAAIGKNKELGKNGELVFHIKDDMKFFRETTKGHKIVMGRKTWESLPGKLPNRTNIVISSHDFDGPDEIIHDLDDFIAKNKDTEEEVFVIGGGKIYTEFLPYAKNLYLTEVDASVDADTFFPEFDKNHYDKTLIKEGKDDDLTFSISKYQLK